MDKSDCDFSRFVCVFSYISNLVENADQIVVVIVLLAFLLLTGILFDAIGVSVTSCDVTPIISMASRKVYGAKRR